MSATPSIPFLPGNTFRIQREDYRKPHSLDYKCGHAIQKFQLLGIGLEEIDANAALLKTSSEQLLASLGTDPKLTYGEKQFHTTPHAPRFVPAFVALDKVVLRFDAYFKETVHDSTEQYHLRTVRILYFLEDDSVAVVEPPVENSGIPQRVFIKRQRLAKQELTSLHQEYYTVRDFNIGINLTFYGRTFRIVGCDKFTEKYLQETEHITLNPSESMPVDPFTTLRNRPRRDYTVASISPAIHHNNKLQKFLQFDRHVLRFFCSWDDRQSMFGELREFIMHYYLVDDTVEVREVAKPNNGRDPFPILLRKQALFKDDAGVCRYDIPEFVIGNTINVLGRPFLIRDCDDYTRDYFKENYHMEPQAPISVQHEDRTVHSAVQEIAPYNGFGTIQDSLGSCKNLVLKPPKKDFIKMLENEHKVLRFVAVMNSKHKEDRERRFVISYRLADDMMTIYEPPQRNAGVLGGKFLERTRVLKNQPADSLSSVSALGMTTTPDYYNANDLFIGAKLDINRHQFVLIDADEYVFNYMEERPQEFPQSDRTGVRNAVGSNPTGIAGIVEQFAAHDLENSGVVDRLVLVGIVKSVVGNKISEHEIITLARPFEEKTRKVDYRKFVASF